MYTRDNIIGMQFFSSLSGPYLIHRAVDDKEVALRSGDMSIDHCNYNISSAITHLNNGDWKIVLPPLESYTIY